MRSGVNVRDDKNVLYANTNLVIHHRIADIFSQTAKFIGILKVGKKSCNLPLVYQWFQFAENVF
jgi:hypothetical protein